MQLLVNRVTMTWWTDQKCNNNTTVQYYSRLRISYNNSLILLISWPLPLERFLCTYTTTSVCFLKDVFFFVIHRAPHSTSIFFSSPREWRALTSSPPPTNLPPIKTLGTLKREIKNFSWYLGITLQVPNMKASLGFSLSQFYDILCFLKFIKLLTEHC